MVHFFLWGTIKNYFSIHIELTRRRIVLSLRQSMLLSLGMRKNNTFGVFCSTIKLLSDTHDFKLKDVDVLRGSLFRAPTPPSVT